MAIDLINNALYNTYADSFDKIPFEDVLVILKYLPADCGHILEIGLELWLCGYHSLGIQSHV